MLWSKYTPLYEKARHKKKNAPMETANGMETIPKVYLKVKTWVRNPV